MVDRLLAGSVLTPELVPALVREARPEGPIRRRALEIALKQRLAPKPASLVNETAAPAPPPAAADPFHLPGDPEMQTTVERAVRPLNGHTTTAALITPPSGAASQEELVGDWLRRHRIPLDQRVPGEIRDRICAETGLSQEVVRATFSRLRKNAGLDLSPQKGMAYGPRRAPQPAAPALRQPTTTPATVAPQPTPDLGSPEEQRRGLVVTVAARLLAGDRDETLLLCARLLDKGL